MVHIIIVGNRDGNIHLLSWEMVLDYVSLVVLLISPSSSHDNP